MGYCLSNGCLTGGVNRRANGELMLCWFDYTITTIDLHNTYEGLPKNNRNSNVVHELDEVAHYAARGDESISF